MILIANSGVLENVVFRKMVWSQNYCLPQYEQKFWDTKPVWCFVVGDWCYSSFVWWGSWGHVILIVLLTIVRKLVSSFCPIVFFFYIYIFHYKFRKQKTCCINKQMVPRRSHFVCWGVKLKNPVSKWGETKWSAIKPNEVMG